MGQNMGSEERSKAVFYIIVIVFSLTLLGMIQEFTQIQPGKALGPSESAAAEAEENIAETEPLLLTAGERDGSVAASADGEISDLLVPEEDVADKIKIETEKIKEENADTIQMKGGDGPNVLIYHTHTTEAYRMTEEDQYKETTEWRTNDQSKSVVVLGDILAEELEKYGFNVIHDKTDHEPPKLATSYSRSLETMQKYLEQYDTLEVMIDLHRDASNVETAQDDVVTIDGQRCARVMFVVGTGEKYDEKPDWKSNYALANAVTNKLNAVTEDFARPIRVKTGRYNQHLTNKSMLIEVGHNANTLQEAKNSIPYVAKALSEVLSKEE